MLASNKNDHKITKVFIALPCEMRKRIKVVAALNDITMNQQIVNFINDGLAASSKKINMTHKNKIFQEQ